jgi:hypothetical protein
MRVGRLAIAVVVVVGLVWAMRTAPRPEPLYPLKPAEPGAELGSAHAPRECGTITGRVIWDGAAPTIPPLDLPLSSLIPSRTRSIPNPNALRVQSSRVAGAIVWLRGVEPVRSRPWDHPPVSVEATELELVTRQGGERVRTGIVRRGEEVSFSAPVADRHSIRGRGAAFFTDLLFVPNRKTPRILPDEGIVELTSATGAYWHRAYLAVSDHPYLTRTNEQGEFRLPVVPSGSYDLVCWLPNWRVVRLERDPELVVHVRMVFGADVEKNQAVRVASGETTQAEFRLGEADFRHPDQASRAP